MIELRTDNNNNKAECWEWNKRGEKPSSSDGRHLSSMLAHIFDVKRDK